MLSSMYAIGAAARRRGYSRPGRQRRLQRPVVSVGNLRIGGSGKTPAVAHVARLLAAMGERPAILSRGYGRRTAPDGVVVVSDGQRLRADLATSGDEPLMLARAIDGARVLVSADRYTAGRLAEAHLGATVHVLDDGFQHLALARGTDLVIVGEDELSDPRTLPAGRLREPLSAASCADAVLVPDSDDDRAADVAGRLGVPTWFRLVREAQAPWRLGVNGPLAMSEPWGPVHAVAGVARPDRFFADLQAGGWDVKGRSSFRDHHRYSARDVARVVAAARREGAGALITTEKDMVRMLPFRPLPIPLIWVPLAVRIEPAGRFREWLGQRLAAERTRAEDSPR